MSHSTLDNAFLNVFTLLGLTQWVNIPTFVHLDNILDLVFTTDGDRISTVTLVDPLPGCDHFPILFKYTFTMPDHSNHLNKYGFYKGNYNLFNSYLSNINLDFEFIDLNID